MSNAEHGKKDVRKTWNFTRRIGRKIARAAGLLDQTETEVATDALDMYTGLVDAVKAGARVEVTIWHPTQRTPQNVTPVPLFSLQQEVALERSRGPQLPPGSN